MSPETHPRYSISVAAELVGMHQQTLRMYEAKGLVRSRLGDPTPQRGGRARRYVAVTPLGVRALGESRRVLLALWRGLEPVLDRP